MHRGILLFGYPGSGKGTQGKILAALPGFHHVAMGDIFRNLGPDNPHHAEVKRLISAGDLVPDRLVIDLFAHHLVERKVPDSDFVIIDGIPRNRAQVGLLARHVDIIRIFKLSVYDEQLVFDRLRKRAVQEGRADDNDAVIKHRLEIYRTQTEACITAYPGGLLTRIHANQPIFDVHLDIVNSLHKMRDIHFF